VHDTRGPVHSSLCGKKGEIADGQDNGVHRCQELYLRDQGQVSLTVLVSASQCAPLASCMLLSSDYNMLLSLLTKEKALTLSRLLRVCSSAYEVCGLVMKPLWSGLDAVCDLGNSLIASPARIRIASRVPYKDVVALAFSLFPLKPVPCTLESFKQALSADNTKGRDFVISNWYVIYVGGSHGNGAGAKRLTAAKKDWRPPSPSHSTASTSRSSGRERGASGASRWSTKETITITRSALKQKAQGIRQRRGGGHSLPVTSQGRACDKEHLAKTLRAEGRREVLVGKEGIMMSRGVESVSVGT